MLLLTSTGGYAQLITMLVIFVVVLGVTAWVTKWIADYQKYQNAGGNIEVIDSLRIAQNKWIQIVRLGDSYKAIAVSKDQVSYLGDLDPASVHVLQTDRNPGSFRRLLDGALNKEKISGDGEGDKETK